MPGKVSTWGAGDGVGEPVVVAGFPPDFLIFFLMGSFVGDPVVGCTLPGLLDDVVVRGPSSMALRFKGLPAPLLETGAPV